MIWPTSAAFWLARVLPGLHQRRRRPVGGIGPVRRWPGFAQGWAFLALTDAADRARFWPFVPHRVEQTPTMQDAPLVVVALSSKSAYLDHYT